MNNWVIMFMVKRQRGGKRDVNGFSLDWNRVENIVVTVMFFMSNRVRVQGDLWVPWV